VWQEAWNGFGGDDWGYDVAVDDTGNVYVTGWSYNGAVPGNDCLTRKYDSAGSFVWQEAWDGVADDGGRGIAVDSSGNVYVTGYTRNSTDTNWDYLTIKYDSARNIVWQKAWDRGLGKDDDAYGIAVDSSGNVYVAGYSTGNSNKDYLTIKYNADGETVWQKAWDGGNDDWGRGIAVDSSRNVYVTGQFYNGTTYDYLTIKYNADGETVWQKAYNGIGADYGYGIAVDSSGNVYVTGYSSNGTNSDYLTIKYDTNGNTVWQKVWNGVTDDGGRGIAVDSSGNVYVTGYTRNSTDTNWDYLTIKYRQY